MYPVRHTGNSSAVGKVGCRDRWPPRGNVLVNLAIQWVSGSMRDYDSKKKKNGSIKKKLEEGREGKKECREQ